MPTRLRFLALIGAAALLPVLAAEAPLVTELEAIHLVERHVPELATTSARGYTERGQPYFLVAGLAGRDGYEAFVNARVARVDRITKNGGAFYTWEGVQVVAHRGAARFAPENTLAAFRKAIELGADRVEMDVRETKDGQLVIMHDPRVDRTTNGKGAVADLTLAEIQKLDAGSRFDPKFADEKVPTFEEALEALNGRALPDIDFKAGTPEKMVATLRRFRLAAQPTLYCGDWELMRRTLEVSRDFILRPTAPRGRLGLAAVIERFAPPLVNIDWPDFTEALIREIHVSGRKAFLNTMGPNDNEFGIGRAIDAGADFIQSDRLDLLIPMLRARGLHR